MPVERRTMAMMKSRVRRKAASAWDSGQTRAPRRFPNQTAPLTVQRLRGPPLLLNLPEDVMAQVMCSDEMNPPKSSSGMRRRLRRKPRDRTVCVIACRKKDDCRDGLIKAMILSL